MPLTKHIWLPAALACLALMGNAWGQTPPAMERDPIGYLHDLETATNPPTVALRQKIEAGPSDLARARGAAAKEGIPLDPAALQKPLPPEDQNAAPVYDTLFQLLKDKPLKLPLYAQPLSSSYAYTPAQIAAVQKIYDSRPDVWNLVHEAADRPQCVFARDWKLGPAVLFPEFARIREAARLLNTETYLLAAQGKYAEAVKNQTRGFHIAEHGASDPVLISYLVGVACETIALRGMQNILTLAGPNADVDAQVQKAVENNCPHLSLRYALGGEVASFQGVAFQQMRASLEKDGVRGVAAMLFGWNAQTPPPMTGETTPADQQFAQRFLDASEAEILDQMRPLVVAADLPPLPRRRAFADAARAKAAAPKTPLTVLSDILLPVFDKIDQNGTREDAWEAVTQAGAAALSARAGGGAFPDALPGGFTDPFTGQPLGYRREGTGGFVVYSAGPDGTFDGGHPGEKPPPGQALFRYPTKPLPVPPNMLQSRGWPSTTTTTRTRFGRSG